MRESSILKRVISLVVVVCFLTTNAMAMPGQTLDGGWGMAGVEKAKAISVPSGLGSVVETYDASKQDGGRRREDGNKLKTEAPSTILHPSPRFVIYIQDAHDSLEAQENIAAMVRHCVKEYGVKTVYEEGYEGPVPTDKLFGSIQDPVLKEKISYYLMDKLRIGGAEYAHINRAAEPPSRETANDERLTMRSAFPVPRSPESDFQLVGADSISLHLENIRAYEQAAKNRTGVTQDIQRIRKELQKLADKNFPKEMKEWLKLKERYQNGQLPLVEYLARTMKIRETDGGWRMAKGVKPGLPPSAIHPPAPSVEALLSGDPKAIKQIDLMKLIGEIQALENEIVEAGLPAERDRKTYGYFESVMLLEKLNKIELSHEEFTFLKDSLEGLKTEDVARFIAKETGHSLVLFKSWENLIADSIHFYELAKKRDQAIEKILTKTTDERLETSDKKSLLSPVSGLESPKTKADISVLVFGGFHKEAIKRILKEKGISYVILSPSIGNPSKRHEDYYRMLMGGGRHSFERMQGIGGRMEDGVKQKTKGFSPSANRGESVSRQSTRAQSVFTMNYGSTVDLLSKTAAPFRNELRQDFILKMDLAIQGRFLNAGAEAKEPSLVDNSAKRSEVRQMLQQGPATKRDGFISAAWKKQRAKLLQSANYRLLEYMIHQTDLSERQKKGYLYLWETMMLLIPLTNGVKIPASAWAVSLAIAHPAFTILPAIIWCTLSSVLRAIFVIPPFAFYYRFRVRELVLANFLPFGAAFVAVPTQVLAIMREEYKRFGDLSFKQLAKLHETVIRKVLEENPKDEALLARTPELTFRLLEWRSRKYGADAAKALLLPARLTDLLQEADPSKAALSAQRATALAKTVIFFPPSGFHQAGSRGSALYENSATIKRLYERVNQKAREILGDPAFDIFDVSFNQTEEDYLRGNNAVAVHLAIATHHMALWESLKEKYPEAGRPGAVLGASRGADAAYYASGALGLEDTVELAVRNIQFLKKASELSGSRRIGSVSRLSRETLEALLAPEEGAIAVQYSKNLFAVSYRKDSFEKLEQDIKSAGGVLRKTLLSVSSHDPHLLTPETKPLFEEYQAFLEGFKARIRLPSLKLFSALEPGKELKTPEDILSEEVRYTTQAIPLDRSFADLLQGAGLQNVLGLGYEKDYFIQALQKEGTVSGDVRVAQAADLADYGSFWNLFSRTENVGAAGTVRSEVRAANDPKDIFEGEPRLSVERRDGNVLSGDARTLSGGRVLSWDEAVQHAPELARRVALSGGFAGFFTHLGRAWNDPYREIDPAIVERYFENVRAWGRKENGVVFILGGVPEKIGELFTQAVVIHIPNVPDNDPIPLIAGKESFDPMVELMKKIGVRGILPYGGEYARFDEQGRVLQGFDPGLGCAGGPLFILSRFFAVHVYPQLLLGGLINKHLGVAGLPLETGKYLTEPRSEIRNIPAGSKLSRREAFRWAALFDEELSQRGRALVSAATKEKLSVKRDTLLGGVNRYSAPEKTAILSFRDKDSLGQIYLLFLDRENRPAGYGSLYSSGKDKPVVVSFHIFSEFRGRGLGEDFWNAIKSFLKQNGMGYVPEKVYFPPVSWFAERGLGDDFKNSGVQEFLVKMGFKPVGVKPSATPGDVAFLYNLGDGEKPQAGVARSEARSSNESREQLTDAGMDQYAFFYWNNNSQFDAIPYTLEKPLWEWRAGDIFVVESREKTETYLLLEQTDFGVVTFTSPRDFGEPERRNIREWRMDFGRDLDRGARITVRRYYDAGKIPTLLHFANEGRLEPDTLRAYYKRIILGVLIIAAPPVLGLYMFGLLKPWFISMVLGVLALALLAGPVLFRFKAGSFIFDLNQALPFRIPPPGTKLSKFESWRMNFPSSSARSEARLSRGTSPEPTAAGEQALGKGPREAEWPEVSRQFRSLNPYNIHNMPSAVLSELASEIANKLNVYVFVRKNHSGKRWMSQVMEILSLRIVYDQDIEVYVKGRQTPEVLNATLDLVERAMQDWKMLEESTKENPLYDAYLREIDQIAQGSATRTLKAAYRTFSDAAISRAIDAVDYNHGEIDPATGEAKRDEVTDAAFRRLDALYEAVPGVITVPRSEFMGFFGKRQPEFAANKDRLIKPFSALSDAEKTALVRWNEIRRSEARDVPEVAQTQGSREEQEDRFVNEKISLGAVPHGEGRLLAVMDGHGGDEVSEMLRANLERVFKDSMLRKNGDVQQALQEVFGRLQKMAAGSESGSTLSLAYVPEDEKAAYVMIVGDSPVYVRKNGRLISFPEHNLSNPVEVITQQQRASSAGKKFRVDYDFKRENGKDLLRKIGTTENTSLAITRAFGNKSFQGLLIGEPSILKTDLSDAQGPVEVLLGTDGIYGFHGNDSKIQRDARAGYLLSRGTDAAGIVQSAGSANASDNVTVLLWKFDPNTVRSEMRQDIHSPARTGAGTREVPAEMRQDIHSPARTGAGTKEVPAELRGAEKPDDRESWTRFLNTYAPALSGFGGTSLEQVWREIFENTPEHARILDLATGNGAVAGLAAAMAAKFFEVWAIDSAEPKVIPQGVNFRKASMETFSGTTDMPADLDLVTGQFAIEYGETDRVLGEIHRAMKAGGKGVFIIHHKNSFWAERAKSLLEQTDWVKKAGIFERIRQWVQDPSEEKRGRFEAVLDVLRSEISKRRAQKSENDVLSSIFRIANTTFEAVRNGKLSGLAEQIQEVEEQWNNTVWVKEHMIHAAFDGEAMARFKTAIEARGFQVVGIEPWQIRGTIRTEEQDLLVGWRVEIQKPGILSPETRQERDWIKEVQWPDPEAALRANDGPFHIPSKEDEALQIFLDSGKGTPDYALNQKAEYLGKLLNILGALDKTRLWWGTGNEENWSGWVKHSFANYLNNLLALVGFSLRNEDPLSEQSAKDLKEQIEFADAIWSARKELAASVANNFKNYPEILQPAPEGKGLSKENTFSRIELNFAFPHKVFVASPNAERNRAIYAEALRRMEGPFQEILKLAREQLSEYEKGTALPAEPKKDKRSEVRDPQAFLENTGPVDAEQFERMILGKRFDDLAPEQRARFIEFIRSRNLHNLAPSLQRLILDHVQRHAGEENDEMKALWSCTLRLEPGSAEIYRQEVSILRSSVAPLAKKVSEGYSIVTVEESSKGIRTQTNLSKTKTEDPSAEVWEFLIPDQVETSGGVYTIAKPGTDAVVIGSGGSGSVVIRARKQDGTPVAMKIIKEDGKSMHRFFLEYLMTLRFKGDPNIIQVYDSGRYVVQAQRFYFIMEEYGERTLADEVRARSKKLGEGVEIFSPPERRKIANEMIDILQTLYAARILHRDVKADNLFYSGGRLKLGDFGIARCLPQEKDEINSDALEGTPTHIPVESFAGASGFYNDLYEFAMTMAFLDPSTLADDFGATTRGQMRRVSVPTSMFTKNLAGLAQTDAAYKKFYEMREFSKKTLAGTLVRLERSQDPFTQLVVRPILDREHYQDSPRNAQELDQLAASVFFIEKTTDLIREGQPAEARRYVAALLGEGSTFATYPIVREKVEELRLAAEASSVRSEMRNGKTSTKPAMIERKAEGKGRIWIAELKYPRKMLSLGVRYAGKTLKLYPYDEDWKKGTLIFDEEEPIAVYVSQEDLFSVLEEETTTDAKGRFIREGLRYNLGENKAHLKISLRPFETPDWKTGVRIFEGQAEIAYHDAKRNRTVNLISIAPFRRSGAREVGTADLRDVPHVHRKDLWKTGLYGSEELKQILKAMLESEDIVFDERRYKVSLYALPAEELVALMDYLRAQRIRVNGYLYRELLQEHQEDMARYIEKTRAAGSDLKYLGAPAYQLYADLLPAAEEVNPSLYVDSQPPRYHDDVFSSLKKEYRAQLQEIRRQGDKIGLAVHGVREWKWRDMSGQSRDREIGMDDGKMRFLNVLLEGRIRNFTMPFSFSKLKVDVGYLDTEHDTNFSDRGDAGTYGPYYILLDPRWRHDAQGGIGEEHHKYYLVPNDSMRKFLTGGLEQALAGGLIDPERLEVLKSKIMTYREYADILSGRGAASRAELREEKAPNRERKMEKIRQRPSRRSDGKESKWDVFDRFVQKVNLLNFEEVKQTEELKSLSKKRELLVSFGIPEAAEVEAKYLIGAIGKLFKKMQAEGAGRQQPIIWTDFLSYGGQGRYLTAYKDENPEGGWIVKVAASEESSRYMDLYSLEGTRLALERLGGGLAASTMIIDGRKNGKDFFFRSGKRAMYESVAIVQEKLLPLVEYLKQVGRRGASDREVSEAIGYMEKYKQLAIAMYRRGIVDADNFNVVGNYGIRPSDKSLAIFDLGDLTDSLRSAQSFVAELDSFNEDRADDSAEIDGVLLDPKVSRAFTDNPFRTEDFVLHGKDLFGSEFDPKKHGMTFPLSEDEVRRMFLGSSIREPSQDRRSEIRISGANKKLARKEDRRAELRDAETWRGRGAESPLRLEKVTLLNELAAKVPEGTKRTFRALANASGGRYSYSAIRGIAVYYAITPEEGGFEPEEIWTRKEWVENLPKGARALSRGQRPTAENISAALKEKFGIVRSPAQIREALSFHKITYREVEMVRDLSIDPRNDDAWKEFFKRHVQTLGPGLHAVSELAEKLSSVAANKKLEAGFIGIGASQIERIMILHRLSYEELGLKKVRPAPKTQDEWILLVRELVDKIPAGVKKTLGNAAQASGGLFTYSRLYHAMSDHDISYNEVGLETPRRQPRRSRADWLAYFKELAAAIPEGFRKVLGNAAEFSEGAVTFSQLLKAKVNHGFSYEEIGLERFYQILGLVPESVDWQIQTSYEKGRSGKGRWETVRTKAVGPRILGPDEEASRQERMDHLEKTIVLLGSDAGKMIDQVLDALAQGASMDNLSDLSEKSDVDPQALREMMGRLRKIYHRLVAGQPIPQEWIGESETQDYPTGAPTGLSQGVLSRSEVRNGQALKMWGAWKTKEEALIDLELKKSQAMLAMHPWSFLALLNGKENPRLSGEIGELLNRCFEMLAWAVGQFHGQPVEVLQMEEARKLESAARQYRVLLEVLHGLDKGKLPFDKIVSQNDFETVRQYTFSDNGTLYPVRVICRWESAEAKEARLAVNVLLPLGSSSEEDIARHKKGPGLPPLSDRQMISLRIDWSNRTERAEMDISGGSNEKLPFARRHWVLNDLSRQATFRNFVLGMDQKLAKLSSASAPVPSEKHRSEMREVFKLGGEFTRETMERMIRELAGQQKVDFETEEGDRFTVHYTFQDQGYQQGWYQPFRAEGERFRLLLTRHVGASEDQVAFANAKLVERDGKKVAVMDHGFGKEEILKGKSILMDREVVALQTEDRYVGLFKGIGTAMMQLACGVARAHGADVLYAESIASKELESFYVQAGGVMEDYQAVFEVMDSSEDGNAASTYFSTRQRAKFDLKSLPQLERFQIEKISSDAKLSGHRVLALSDEVQKHNPSPADLPSNFEMNRSEVRGKNINRKIVVAMTPEAEKRARRLQQALKLLATTYPEGVTYELVAKTMNELPRDPEPSLSWYALAKWTEAHPDLPSVVLLRKMQRASSALQDALSDLVKRPAKQNWTPDLKKLRHDLLGKALELNLHGAFVFHPYTDERYVWRVLGFMEDGWKAVFEDIQSKEGQLLITLRLEKEGEEVFLRTFAVGKEKRALLGVLGKKGQPTKQALDILPLEDKTIYGEEKKAYRILSELVGRPEGYAWQADEDKLNDLIGEELGEVSPRGVSSFSPAKYFAYRWFLLGTREAGWSARIMEAGIRSAAPVFKVKFYREDGKKEAFEKEYQLGPKRKDLKYTGPRKNTAPLSIWDIVPLNDAGVFAPERPAQEKITEALAALLAEGAVVSQALLAEKADVGENTVVRIKKENAVLGKKIDEAVATSLYKKIEAFLKDHPGAKQKDIAEAIGVSPSAIVYYKSTNEEIRKLIEVNQPVQDKKALSPGKGSQTKETRSAPKTEAPRKEKKIPQPRVSPAQDKPAIPEEKPEEGKAAKPTELKGVTAVPEIQTYAMLDEGIVTLFERRYAPILEELSDQAVDEPSETVEKSEALLGRLDLVLKNFEKSSPTLLGRLKNIRGKLESIQSLARVNDDAGFDGSEGESRDPSRSEVRTAPDLTIKAEDRTRFLKKNRGKDLNEMVKSMIRDATRYSEEGAARVLYAEPKEPVFIPEKYDAYLGYSALDTALWEIFGNALKYSPKEKPIRIALEREPGHILLKVSDSGIGISAEEMKHAGTVGWRGERAQAYFKLGAGRGIAQTKEIIERIYGGSVTIESPGENQGTIVTITLPLSDSAGRAKLDSDKLRYKDTADFMARHSVIEKGVVYTVRDILDRELPSAVYALEKVQELRRRMDASGKRETPLILWQNMSLGQFFPYFSETVKTELGVLELSEDVSKWQAQIADLQPGKSRFILIKQKIASSFPGENKDYANYPEEEWDPSVETWGAKEIERIAKTLRAPVVMVDHTGKEFSNGQRLLAEHAQRSGIKTHWMNSRLSEDLGKDKDLWSSDSLLVLLNANADPERKKSLFDDSENFSKTRRILSGIINGEKINFVDALMEAYAAATLQAQEARRSEMRLPASGGRKSSGAVTFLKKKEVPGVVTAVSFEGKPYALSAIGTMLQIRDQFNFGILLFKLIPERQRNAFIASLPRETQERVQAYRRAPAAGATRLMVEVLKNEDFTAQIKANAAVQIGIGQDLATSVVRFEVEQVSDEKAVFRIFLGEVPVEYDVSLGKTYMVAREKVLEEPLDAAELFTVSSDVLSAGKHFSFRMFLKDNATWIHMVDYKSTNGTVLWAEVYPKKVDYPRRKQDRAICEKEIRKMLEDFSDKMRADGLATDPETKDVKYQEALNEAASLYIESSKFHELEELRKKLIENYFFSNTSSSLGASTRSQYALETLESLLEDDRISVWEPILEAAVKYVRYFVHLVRLLKTEKLKLAPSKLQYEMVRALSKINGKETEVPEASKFNKEIFGKTLRIDTLPRSEARTSRTPDQTPALNPGSAAGAKREESGQSVRNALVVRDRIEKLTGAGTILMSRMELAALTKEQWEEFFIVASAAAEGRKDARIVLYGETPGTVLEKGRTVPETSREEILRQIEGGKIFVTELGMEAAFQKFGIPNKAAVDLYGAAVRRERHSLVKSLRLDGRSGLITLALLYVLADGKEKAVTESASGELSVRAELRAVLQDYLSQQVVAWAA